MEEDREHNSRDKTVMHIGVRRCRLSVCPQSGDGHATSIALDALFCLLVTYFKAKRFCFCFHSAKKDSVLEVQVLLFMVLHFPKSILAELSFLYQQFLHSLRYSHVKN